jgi:hypothetical protein
MSSLYGMGLYGKGLYSSSPGEANVTGQGHITTSADDATLRVEEQWKRADNESSKWSTTAESDAIRSSAGWCQ